MAAAAFSSMSRYSKSSTLARESSSSYSIVPSGTSPSSAITMTCSKPTRSTNFSASGQRILSTISALSPA
jgi:hypothetical protein